MPAAPPISRRLRRWLLNIHLYGGLLSSSYLVLYGVSSLLFNHPMDFFQRSRGSSEWSAAVSPPVATLPPAEAARRAADELGLVGRIIPPDLAWGDGGALEFGMVRPGMEYAVSLAPDGSATVVADRTGLQSITTGLHDARRYPESLALTVWWHYTHVAVFVLIFSALSGIVLWIASRRYRRIGWPVLVGGSAAFLALAGWMVF